MDAINDPSVETVVVKSSAQVGKTEILLNIIGYFVDYDPAPMLLMQPTLEMAQAFSKDRLAPMIRDTPAIKNKFSGAKSKVGENTLLHKAFIGGHLTIVGANSAAGLASRPIRILLVDEIDRFPLSAGTEGDPFLLARKRTNNFWNRKIVVVSTPTIKGQSRIDDLYEHSTKERYQLACPTCCEYQAITWDQIIFDQGPGAACDKCGDISGQYDWTRKPGIWIADNPAQDGAGNAIPAKVRGFHLNELVSPWRRWQEIIDEFKIAKDNPQTLKVWVNTSLGETFEETGERVDPDALFLRRECYEHDIPDPVLCLVAAVDVQDDRLEIEVKGYGFDHESYSISFRQIHGDPSQNQMWRDLDDYLKTTWENGKGQHFKIACCVVDSGGHYTERVYQYVKATDPSRRIYAIKGNGGYGKPLLSRSKKAGKAGAKLFICGVDEAKETIAARLNMPDPGPGYMHYPNYDNYDQEFFLQLASEEKRIKFSFGRPVPYWFQLRKRNEAFDLAVYNWIALNILNPNYRAIHENLNPEPDQKPKPKTRRRKLKGF